MEEGSFIISEEVRYDVLYKSDDSINPEGKVIFQNIVRRYFSPGSRSELWRLFSLSIRKWWNNRKNYSKTDIRNETIETKLGAFVIGASGDEKAGHY